MLWLCLDFPNLSIDIFTGREDAEEPTVITNSKNIIIAKNKACQHIGIKAGMSLSAAYAVYSLIRVKRRNIYQEEKTLESIAMSLFKYSSQISLSTPNSILIEIGASVKLFHGIQNLRKQILETINELGVGVQTAVSPTPLSATWLSRHKVNATVLMMNDIPQYVNPLPASVIEFKHTSTTQPRDAGLKTIGQLVRAPRSAVTQRWGLSVLDQLDRVFGIKPDPQTFFVLPDYFSTEISLNLPASSVPEIIFGIRRITQSMANYLSVKQRGVLKFNLTVANEEQDTHIFHFKLSGPSRDPKHLTSLIQERLSRETIPSRIESIHLKSIQEPPLAPSIDSLIPQEENTEFCQVHLIDQLQAKLGNDCVYGITVCADHRPENSWRATTPGERHQQTQPRNRPSWLLHKPIALTSTSNIPHLRGPLVIISGPERIETGWWDDNDIKRDYFLARTQDHSQVWIYQETINDRWFLHGIFA